MLNGVHNGGVLCWITNTSPRRGEDHPIRGHECQIWRHEWRKPRVTPDLARVTPYWMVLAPIRGDVLVIQHKTPPLAILETNLGLRKEKVSKKSILIIFQKIMFFSAKRTL